MLNFARGRVVPHMYTSTLEGKLFDAFVLMVNGAQ